MSFAFKKQFSFLASGHRSKMDIRFFILLILLPQMRITHSAHALGTITENTTFFYRKLPVAPSVRATIEFNISYSQQNLGNKYPSMGIFTTYPKLNVDTRCSYQQFGQLRNENLYPHFKLSRRYRTTTCELSGADTVICSGRVAVQDYIPRNFYLTFEFDCDRKDVNTLKDLRYNIGFTKQSNDTNRCTDYSVFQPMGVCGRFYNEHLFLILLEMNAWNRVSVIWRVSKLYMHLYFRMELVINISGNLYVTLFYPNVTL